MQEKSAKEVLRLRLRILFKVLIIGLAIVMAGGTTMIWYSLQTKKAAGEGDAATKPILTVNKSEAGKNVIMNLNPAGRNNILFCTLDINGTWTSCLRAGYAVQPAETLFEPIAFESEQANGFRRIYGNPPIRAAPEPRGPL